MSPMEKRAEIEAEILKVLAIIEPGGYNVKHYKEQVFPKMSNSMFFSWIDQIEKGEANIYMYCPNMVVNLKPKDILKAAAYLGLELFERIRIWDSLTGRYYMTPQKYLTLLIPIRRLSQYLMHKISIPESDRRTNPTTGQVVKPDKGSSFSMVQSQILDSAGLTNSLFELATVRGGNQDAQSAARSSLIETGELRLSDIDTSQGVRSQQVAKATFESMHIETNL
mgnify:FL=1